jgi:glycosidase
MEFNVDGLRLDAAKHIYPDDRAEDTHAWWQEFGDAMRSTKPGVYLVGEVWGKPETIAPYMSGLHSMFNFDLYHDLHNIIIDEKNNKLVKNLIVARKTYSNKEKSFIDAIFVNNHDISRLISEVEDNTKKAALAFTILQTLPGMPYLYYGDEIGMLGAKPDEYIREPFLWAEEGMAVEQTTWLEAKNSTYENVIPLSLQLEDSASTYAFYKYWIAVRNASDILQKGDIKPLKLDPALLGYSRSYKSKKLCVLHNLTDEIQSIEVDKMGLTEIFASQNLGVKLYKERLLLPAYSSAILR